VGEGGLLGFAQPGFLEGLEAGEVSLGECELGERRTIELKRGAGLVVELTSFGEAAGLLKGTQGAGGLIAGDAVDRSAGKPKAGQGDLGFEPGLDRARVGARGRRREFDEWALGRVGGERGGDKG